MSTTSNIKNKCKPNDDKTYTLHQAKWAWDFAKIELIYKGVRKNPDYCQ
jgi:hypothetical protein